MSDEPDTWKINYLPSEGRRYTGKLAVTTDGLRFATLYESSSKAIAGS